MNLVTPREVGQLPHTVSVRRNLKLQLSDRQSQILIGSVLGDGYIYQLGKIQLEHSDHQQEYLKWKYQELQNLAYKAISKVERVDKRSGKIYISYRFWLRQYFRSWRQYFYEGSIKTFPSSLRISPLSLAVWYMDDGSYSDKKFILSTESFNKLSLERIIKELEQLGIDAYIRSNQKISIRARSNQNFLNLIQPHIHKSMKYKLP